MRTPLIAGNWKMNGSLEDLEPLARDIAQVAAGLSGCDLALFPSHPYLSAIAEIIDGSKVELGAQDVSEFEPGAYTGEVGARMLLDIGCQWSLVGHSERRSLFGDTDQRIAEKVSRASNEGLNIMLCVGETQAEREAGETMDVVRRQLDAVLSTSGAAVLIEGAVAYEPVWAIGTGLTATPEQANEVHAAIRSHIGSGSDALRVLYGGSVKPDNAAGLLAMSDIDGALVGGAALDSASFLAIAGAAR